VLTLFPKGGETEWLRSFTHAVDFRPRFCETDAYLHVSNVSYAVYFEFARASFLEAAYDPEKHGPMHFMHLAVEINMQFVRPIYYDEPLKVWTRLASLGRTSIVLEHAITGAGDVPDLRTIGQVAAVGSDGERGVPWSDVQRAALEKYTGRSFALS